MLHFYMGLFGPLYVAGVVTVFEAIVKYLSADRSKRSLVYVAEALLINLVILDDMVDTADAYEHAANINASLLYLEVLFFFLYAGALLSIEPNQKALHIDIPILRPGSRKRLSFWLFLTLSALLGFVWSLVVQGFHAVFLTILVFLVCCIVGSFIDGLADPMKEDSPKGSARWTAIVFGLTVVWIILKRSHIIHV